MKSKVRCLIKILFLLQTAWIGLYPQARAGAPVGIWATVLGGPRDDYIQDLAVSRDGVIYAAGYFDHSAENVNFGPWTNGIVKFDSAGNRVGGLPMLTSPGQPNVQLAPLSIRFDSEGNFAVLGNSYLAKYDSKDQLLWRKDLPTDFFGARVAIDRDKSIIFTGSLTGPGKIDHVTFGEGGVIAKFASDGTLKWARGIQGKQSAAGAVEFDRAGNIFVLGYLSGGETDLGGKILYLEEPAGFLAKFTPDGDLKWVQSGYGSTGLAVDSRGDCYFTGYYYNAFGLSEAQFGKMSGDGELLWLYHFYEGAYNPYPNDVTLDKDGYPVFIGEFYRTVDFGRIKLTSKSHSMQNLFVLRMSPAGEVVWAISGGGADFSRGQRVAVDGNGEIYAGGVIQNASGEILGLPLKVIRTDGYEAFLVRIHDDRVVSGPALTASAVQGAGLLISWPAGQDRFVLERASSLGSDAAWAKVLEEPLTVGDQKVFSVFPDQPAAYYRLRSID